MAVTVTTEAAVASRSSGAKTTVGDPGRIGAVLSVVVVVAGIGGLIAGVGALLMMTGSNVCRSGDEAADWTAGVSRSNPSSSRRARRWSGDDVVDASDIVSNPSGMPSSGSKRAMGNGDGASVSESIPMTSDDVVGIAKSVTDADGPATGGDRTGTRSSAAGREAAGKASVDSETSAGGAPAAAGMSWRDDRRRDGERCLS